MRRGKRRKRRLIWGSLGVLALWVGGDFAYSRVIAFRLDRWEEAVERDETGVRVGCRETTIGRGDTAILLIHGFADSPGVFHRMAPVLADRGFTCRVMRLPGSAEPIEAMAQTGSDAWRRSVDAEIRALHSDHSRVVVVGHSLGGTLALEHVLAHPGAADGLVLIAPLLRVSRERSPVLSARAWYECARTALQISDVVENWFPRDVAADEAEGPMSERFLPRSVYDGMFDVVDSVREHDEDLATPVLIVVGDRDKVVDTEAVVEFFEHCRSDDKELVCLEDTGHVIPLDQRWEDATDAIARFAGRVARTGGARAASAGPPVPTS